MKTIFNLLFLPAFFYSALSAQGVQPSAADAKIKDFEVKIARTAAELGVTVYEDFPVYGVPGAGAPAAVVTVRAVPPVRRPVPELLKQAELEAQPADGNSMPKGQKLGYLVVAYHTICAQLADSGLLPWVDGAPGFDEISEKAIAAVKDSKYGPRKAGEASLFREEGFVRELEALSGARFGSGGMAEFLVDGPASFAVKDRLMRGAKKSIYVTTYAINDDITGNVTTEILLARKKEGVDIKFVTDNKMAYIFGGRNLKRLAQAGIDVLRYEDIGRKHDYLHVKLLIVDGEYAVAGGMNYADPYSHKDPAGLKWRDTDVLYTGPAVTDSVKIFAEMWNARVTEPGKQVAIPQSSAAGAGTARISAVMQNPPGKTSPILNGIIKAMYGATRRINIENAYIVAIPAVMLAIADAAARGVEVNVLTNSKESIDSDGKSFADSILKSAKVFAEAGANVYLKQGETLHSKFMTVDGVFCSVGSYNLHPRSERYDTEFNVHIIDPVSVAQIDEAFARDMAAAKKVTAKDLSGKPSWLSRIMEKYFFAQLSAKKQPEIPHRRARP